MLDAYSIRKAIPRIVIAVIGINLSIYLCVVALDITTIIGRGMNDLLVSPFKEGADLTKLGVESNLENDVLGIVGGAGLLAGVLGIIFAPGVAIALGIGLLLLLLPMITLISFIALGVLFTLIIRQALLVFLTVVSPVAIACYILPGTEKYFKQWWDLYLKTLLVYPIIAVIFAMSNVMCMILLSNASSGVMVTGAASMFQHGLQVAQSDSIGLVQILVAVIALYAPLALIPFAFKLAGGTIAAVMNMANGRANKIGGMAAGGIKKSKSDGFLNNYANKSKDRRVQSGLTARQLASRIPGGKDRAGRIAAAREYDQKKFTAESQDAFGAKAYAQDSDVMASMVMTDEQVSAERAKLSSNRSAIQAAYADGELSQTDYEGKMRANDRQMKAHAIADRLGRTSANQRAAFLNADRIKYTTPQGKEGYETDLAMAQRIFGDDSSVGEAMNAWQGIASGPGGRGDLPAGLYGEEFDSTRAAEKLSAGQVLSGHANGVKGALQTQLDVLNSDTASLKQKEAAIQMLTSLQSSAASSFGPGSEGNKSYVKSRQADLDAAYQKFANDPKYAAVVPNDQPIGPQLIPNKNTSSFHKGGTEQQPTGRQMETTVTDRNHNVVVDTNGDPIKVTKPEMKTIPGGSQAAFERIRRQSGQSPDMSQLQSQAAEQQAQATKPPEPKE